MYWYALFLHTYNEQCLSLFSVCTPVGFSRMFTVMGELIAKPKVGE